MKTVAAWMIAVSAMLVVLSGVVAFALAGQWVCYRVWAPLFVGDDTVAQAIFCRPHR